jgi:outer membrane lipopolysaccharide assembly protein LptE/RlpB
MRRLSFVFFARPSRPSRLKALPRSARSNAAKIAETAWSLPLAWVLLATVACGYHTVGHVVTFPQNVKTLAIPAFVNQSQTYRIEQMLTTAVVHEFTTRTHYQILNEANDAADATLRGTVLTTSASPLTYDSRTGRAESILVIVSMRVSVVDRQGKILFQNPSYVFREQYQVSQEPSSFFEEDSPALGRLSRDFAQTLVSSVLEGF